MKIVVTQENLSRALSTVSRVASSRSSLPILSNVLIKTEDNRLKIAATNLDIAITDTIGAKVLKEGSITVPARLMQDFVTSLPSGNLNIELKDNKLYLKADRFDATINGIPADDFPVMPTIEKGTEVVFSTLDLKTALNKVLFTASSDEARPVLTGVYFSENNGKLCVAATDSYRLSEKRLDKKIPEGMELLIPAHSLQELLRSLKEDTEPVSIIYDDIQARFTVGGVEIVTRLIDGKYPDYRKLLPVKFETTATLTKQAFTEITKVSSLFAREAAGSITLAIDEAKKEISIRSIASQVGENTATATADIHGEATITMNSRYILEALNSFDGENITINVNGKLDPCIFTDPSDETYLHVIMPVKS